MVFSGVEARQDMRLNVDIHSLYGQLIYLKAKMPSILIQLDDVTYQALNRVAPAAERKRTEFVRQAVKDAIRKQEFARMREAYRTQPDHGAESDDWSNWEDFEA
jgi:hypothetical protein